MIRVALRSVRTHAGQFLMTALLGYFSFVHDDYPVNVSDC